MLFFQNRETNYAALSGPSCHNKQSYFLGYE